MIASASTETSWKLSESDDYTETDLLFADWHRLVLPELGMQKAKTNSNNPIASTYALQHHQQGTFPGKSRKLTEQLF